MTRRRAPRRHGQRGFTLIELAISIALMAIVMGTCAVVLAQVLDGNRRAQAHSEMLRDATFASELLNTELRQAGLGVPAAFDETCAPSGTHVRHDCDILVAAGCTPLYGTKQGGGAYAGGDDGTNFYASVIVAAVDQVGVVGDVPRPDAQYNAYGPLHNRPTGESDANSALRLMWHNENNGSCAPGNGGCSLATNSTFFADGTAAQACSTGNVNARTCPWGMRRLVPAERVQIVAGDGGWSNAAVGTGPTVIDVGGGRLALDLSTPFDLAKSDGNFAEDGVWANRLQGEGPGGIRGTGWVTTLDRVFYFHDNGTKTLQRIQCFGDPDPNNANWPSENASAIPAIGSLALTPAASGVPAAANTCVGPEVVARNVDSVTFEYFNRLNASLAVPVVGATAPTCPAGTFTAPTAGKSAIRRIDYVINFKKVLDTNAAHDVRHSVRGSVRLQNL